MHGFTTTLTAQTGHVIGRDEIEPVVSLGGA